MRSTLCMFAVLLSLCTVDFDPLAMNICKVSAEETKEYSKFPCGVDGRRFAVMPTPASWLLIFVLGGLDALTLAFLLHLFAVPMAQLLFRSGAHRQQWVHNMAMTFVNLTILAPEEQRREKEHERQ